MSGPNAKNMQTFLCTIHNAHYAYEPLKAGKEQPYAGCPYCSREEINQLKDIRDELKDQRNKLLAAIDVAKLVEAKGGA
jgi:hypothetical protein